MKSIIIYSVLTFSPNPFMFYLINLNDKRNEEDLFKITVFTIAYKWLGKPLKPLLA
jgi:hypothetical protein